MPIYTARIHLSGGASNIAAIASLGGAVSLQGASGVGSQVLSWPGSAMSGITLCEAMGLALGDATLSYQQSTGLLRLYDAYGSVGATLGSDGLYQCGVESRHFIVDIDSSLLPGSDDSKTVTVLSGKNAVYDDVLTDERAVGRTEYRCLYLMNESADNVTLFNVTLAIGTPLLGQLFIAKEYVKEGSGLGIMHAAAERWFLPNRMLEMRAAMVGKQGVFSRYHPYWLTKEETSAEQDSDGATVDVSPLAADERDSTHVTGPLTWSDSVSWTQIGAQRYVSFWLRRFIDSGSTGDLIHDLSDLTLTYLL